MSNPIGDRNVLLGILAVQKNIIKGDVLTAALNAWALDKTKGLAQILREQKAITENQHAVLEELVDVQLRKHGNDAREGLAAIHVADAIRQDLQRVADADVQASAACAGREASEEERGASEVGRKNEEQEKAEGRLEEAKPQAADRCLATGCLTPHLSPRALRPSPLAFAGLALVIGCGGMVLVAGLAVMVVAIGIVLWKVARTKTTTNTRSPLPTPK